MPVIRKGTITNGDGLEKKDESMTALGLSENGLERVAGLVRNLMIEIDAWCEEVTEITRAEGISN